MQTALRQTVIVHVGPSYAQSARAPGLFSALSATLQKTRRVELRRGLRPQVTSRVNHSFPRENQLVSLDRMCELTKSVE
jgi:hypothetical protein